MGFLDELKRLAHPYEDELDDNDYDDYDDQPEPAPEPKRERERERSRESQSSYAEPERRSNKVVNIHTTTQLQVVLVKPARYADSAPEIADHLRFKRTVVLNLETIKPDDSRRLLDFLTGVTYSNEGQLKRVAEKTYIVTPYNVDIQGDLLDELENNGMFF